MNGIPDDEDPFLAPGPGGGWKEMLLCSVMVFSLWGLARLICWLWRQAMQV